jgi:hypothetical protein
MTQAEFAEYWHRQNYLSTMEGGDPAEISREFAKSVEWLLTGGLDKSPQR